MLLDLFCAVILDFILGDPSYFPHPIKLMGSLIAAEEKLVRRYAKSSRALLCGGGVMVLTNLLLALFVPYLFLRLLQPYSALYHAVQIYLLYTCLAARCLRDEAMKVYTAIEQGIEEARARLSYIVGRDTTQLDEPEIIRATVETVAENTSDGIIAPLLYGMLGGAPLALAYKMVNTMDSMLGYLDVKYKDIGYFPAKIDDAFNYIPARVTAVLMILGSIVPTLAKVSKPSQGFFHRLAWFHILDGFKIMIRDHKNHKSPNCAYPEGALAGLLGIQLGGDNVYFGRVVKKPTIGDPKKMLNKDDIPQSITIMFRTEILCLLVYLLVST